MCTLKPNWTELNYIDYKNPTVMLQQYSGYLEQIRTNEFCHLGWKDIFFFWRRTQHILFRIYVTIQYTTSHLGLFL